MNKDSHPTPVHFDQVETDFRILPKGEQPKLEQSLGKLLILNSPARDGIADNVWEEFDEFLTITADKLSHTFQEDIKPAIQELETLQPELINHYSNPLVPFLYEMIIAYFTDFRIFPKGIS